MDPLWKIALRNVMRNKRRTAITGIVMSVGIGLFIFTDSLLVGMDRITIDNMVDYTDSYLRARTPEYAKDLAGTPLAHGIPDPAGAAKALVAVDPEIVAVAPRTRFVARLSNYEDEIPVVATVVDPALDAKVLGIASLVSEGQWLGGSERNQAVMGASLAKELKLAPGDYILVSATTVHENVNADEFRIVGLLDGPIPDINKSGFFVSYADAEAFLGLGGLVTELVSKASRSPNLNSLLAGSKASAERARAALPGLAVESVGDMAADYLAMRQMKGKFSYVIVFVVLLIAGVGIVNTVLMSVYARIREIGVLRAYGMSPKDIKKLFTREGIIVGALGSLGGLLFGMILVAYTATIGIPIDSLIGSVDMGGIPLSGTMYGEWNFKTMVAGFLFGLVVAFVSARIPAKKASKLEVTEALRFV